MDSVSFTQYGRYGLAGNGWVSPNVVLSVSALETLTVDEVIIRHHINTLAVPPRSSHPPQGVLFSTSAPRPATSARVFTYRPPTYAILEMSSTLKR